MEMYFIINDQNVGLKLILKFNAKDIFNSFCNKCFYIKKYDEEFGNWIKNQILREMYD